MSVQHGTHTVGSGVARSTTATEPVATKAPGSSAVVSAEDAGRAGLSVVTRRILAVLRFATGFIFLWAFLDKTFGLGYSTTTAKSWINGGSPTKGFLASADVGPFTGIAHAIAGTWWADWLFMLGMLAVGVAVMAGIALRPAAVAGSLILLMMWATEFPIARFTTTGDPSGSTNPIVDYHIIYALSLIILAATSAGLTWGLGRYFNRLPYIRDHAWTH
jgi:thiosulfate dehydrogenase [quinone] large subunit